ncbi:BamA/TamA family outer membrane protein [Dysgonomonas sp. HGC4]|uniref:translocation and assembly module lipoprotein TamL n=1 Tax=Dysgonomonas sp. HGC4 TaxID=1658009 RepID=UPI000680E444|nr:BamA/TamA family outer membrane protein [Dysgonomonas sp. HGC4]MBD8349085.1 BamA/TamA family outer membrane protein [Dysgonomonas sp. HGC4]
MKKTIYCLLILFSIWSCNSTKHVPEGSYLLKGYNIDADSKAIDGAYFESFIRQQPNNKIRLAIYNIAGQDTSKWLNRIIKKMGQAPVLYNPQQTKTSANQVAKELSNLGYLRAEVDTLLKVQKKKVTVTYDIHNNGVYKIRSYDYTLANPTIAKSLAPAKKYTSIQPGITFNQIDLEDSRVNLTSYLRNIGYYKFSKELLYYKADTTLNAHQVDLFLSLYPPRDSTSFKKFKIRNVSILSGFDPMARGNEKLFSEVDTVNYKGINVIYGKNRFLRKSTLYRNNAIRPGKYYSDMAFTRTTGAFNGIGVVKQTNIQFTEVSHPNDSVQYIDALITIAPGNTHFFQTEIQGTNSAGDLGIAPSITYQHQNLFNGAEILRLKLRGAYEFISNSSNPEMANQNFFEIGADASLAFPQFLFPWLKPKWREQPSASTQVSLGINNQHRQEYTRQFFNATLTYRWTSNQNKFAHSVNLWDINYIRMPWISNDFKERLANSNPILKESYKDQLISRTTYNITYTNANSRVGRRVPKNIFSIRAGIDVSGLLPRLVTAFYDAPRDSLGAKKILGIRFAEYIKGDLSFAQTHTLNTKNRIAYHIGIGVASPFGNSAVLPFETRYFAGGANSVRGWATRDLGPGSYVADSSGVNDFVNQVGDIKLDMNIEYRSKVSEYIELAGFIDAGNIWTMKNYKESQPNGQFRFNKFYKEIALSYGAGVRFDLGFLLLRFDYGIRAYDPGRAVNDRWVIFKPALNRTAWHFAIGYPF